MRRGRTQLRGEAGRVAERVRVVIAASRDDDGDAYDDGGGYVGGYGRGHDSPAEPLSDETRGGGVLARLTERLPVRVDPGRRAALAIAAVVAVVAVATGLWVLSSRPRTMPVSAATPSVSGATPLVPSGSSGAGSQPGVSPSAVAPASPASSAATVVVVDVAGKVRRPGLYRLPPGSRVNDAITAAGGPVGGVDLTSLNLASLVTDGQQIAVGRPGAVSPVGGASGGGGIGSGSGSAGSGGGSAGGPVNLNTATLEQLEALPGIGPALGQRILDYRTEHGSFRSVDQLDDVSGIGTVTFQRLKPLVTV